MSEHRTYVHTSSGPEQIVKSTLSYNRALDLRDALCKIRGYNLAKTVYDYEKLKGTKRARVATPSARQMIRKVDSAELFSRSLLRKTAPRALKQPLLLVS